VLPGGAVGSRKKSRRKSVGRRERDSARAGGSGMRGRRRQRAQRNSRKAKRQARAARRHARWRAQHVRPARGPMKPTSRSSREALRRTWPASRQLTCSAIQIRRLCRQSAVRTRLARWQLIRSASQIRRLCRLAVLTWPASRQLIRSASQIRWFCRMAVLAWLASRLRSPRVHRSQLPALSQSQSQSRIPHRGPPPRASPPVMPCRWTPSTRASSSTPRNSFRPVASCRRIRSPSSALTCPRASSPSPLRPLRRSRGGGVRWCWLLSVPLSSWR